MFLFIVNSWLSLWLKPKEKNIQAKHKLNFGSTQQKKTIWSWRANHLIIIKPISYISYKKPQQLKTTQYKNNIFNLATTLLFSFHKGNQMCTKRKSKALLHIAAPVFMAMSTGFQEGGFVRLPMAANLAFS